MGHAAHSLKSNLKATSHDGKYNMEIHGIGLPALDCLFNLYVQCPFLNDMSGVYDEARIDVSFFAAGVKMGFLKYMNTDLPVCSIEGISEGSTPFNLSFETVVIYKRGPKSPMYDHSEEYRGTF